MENSNLVPFDEGTTVLEKPKASETPEVSTVQEKSAVEFMSPERPMSKRSSKLDSFSPAFKEPEKTRVIKTVVWYGLVLGTMVVFALTFTVKRSTPSHAKVVQSPKRGLSSEKKNARVGHVRGKRLKSPVISTN